MTQFIDEPHREQQLSQKTIVERIEPFPDIDPMDDIYRRMNGLDGSIVATRDFWVITAALIYEKWDRMDYDMKKKDQAEMLTKFLPVSTHVMIRETAKEIRADDAINDLSDCGKGKKNRFMHNQTMIRMLGRELVGSL